MATKTVEFYTIEQGQFFKQAPVDNRDIHIKDSCDESTNLGTGEVDPFGPHELMEVVEIKIEEI